MRTVLSAERALEIVSNQWFVATIHELKEGARRYSEIQRGIAGVTKKMLTQTLRRMERDGLVRRTVHPTVPPQTEYELTDLGQSLLPHLKSLCRWAEAHYDQVLASRDGYDGIHLRSVR